LNSAIKLFPNPANESLSINFASLPVMDIKSINIFSIDGRKMEINYSVHSIKNNTLIVDISAIDAGTYCIIIITEENIFNSKFVKHK
jgi:hypothetical protein